jgi:hypothetical protein
MRYGDRSSMGNTPDPRKYIRNPVKRATENAVAKPLDKPPSKKKPKVNKKKTKKNK